MSIPNPECHWGYTRRQIEEIVGGRSEEFQEWMRGQTVSICNRDPQREWVDDAEAPGGCRLIEVGPPLCTEAHGPVVYRWDLERFLAGLAVID